MTIKEIRKEVKSLNNKETKEINGYIVKKIGNAFYVRTGDYMENPYTYYTTQKSLIEAIA